MERESPLQVQHTEQEMQTMAGERFRDLPIPGSMVTAPSRTWYVRGRKHSGHLSYRSAIVMRAYLPFSLLSF